MGWTQLPERPPSGGGRMSGTIVLERDELAGVVELLKAAVAEFAAASGLANRHAASPAGASYVPSPAATPVPAVAQLRCACARAAQHELLAAAALLTLAPLLPAAGRSSQRQ